MNLARSSARIRAALLLAAAVACWGGSFGGGAVRAEAAETWLAPVPDGDFRYKDILGQAYGAALIAGYAYTDTQVKIALDPTGRYFSGTLTATGLKPNFAYQLKLVGDPSLAGDPTNERLGYLGRWWRVSPDPAGNSTDAEYSDHYDDPGYVFQGYLLFEFFVTDGLGNATVTFQAGNSFHVLWRQDQRAPQSDDGPLQEVTLPPTAGNPAYDADLPARLARLYGEREDTRALPGELVMPLGHYRCTFLLTEESFHDGTALAGAWAAALEASIEFDLAAAPPSFVSGPAAAPNPVTGKTTDLSVLASDDCGEDKLTYTWSATAKPAGAANPSFSVNGRNSAKNTTVRFSRAGAYTLRVVARDKEGLTASATVDVTVSQTATSVQVSPAKAHLPRGGSVQLSAKVYDQFGSPLAIQPVITWTVSGGGSVSDTGLFSAGISGKGKYVVTASAGGLSGTARVTAGLSDTSSGSGGCSISPGGGPPVDVRGWALPYAVLAVLWVFRRCRKAAPVRAAQ